ncbi:MAG: hypothetical protein ACR2MX_18820 [Cyclobacteriaceae bacterium]
MRTIHWLLFFLVILLLCMAWLQWFPEGALVAPHASYSTMLVGQYYAGNAYWVFVLLGWSMINIFILCLYLGLRHRRGQKSIVRWLATGYLLYCLAYAMMVLADLNYINADITNYFLGFPAPTAWMIYGMWFVPLLFSILFISKYNSWVINSDDLKTFEKILQDRKQKLDPGQLKNL